MNEPKISVAVYAPEGLPPLRVMLSCKPKNQAQFDAVVEACGGPCAFSYHSEFSAHATLTDGVVLMLEPHDRALSYSPPLAPSIAKLQAACKR